jgi:hypothetical protein
VLSTQYITHSCIQAIHSWLGKTDQSELHKHQLESNEVTILEKIKEFLGHFHSFQQLLSAERTPTIHLVIPAFEGLIADLNESPARRSILGHAYSTALAKLIEYKRKCLTNPVYILAMGMSLHADIVRPNDVSSCFPRN